MSILSKIVLGAAGAAVFAATPALADEAGKGRFVHEGYTYVYKVTEQQGGRKISGTRYPDGQAFHLRVVNGKVVGTSGGQQVAFNVEDARGASATK
jgi:hypothetical protein